MLQTHIYPSLDGGETCPVSDGGVPGPTVEEQVARINLVCHVVVEGSPVGPLVYVYLKKGYAKKSVHR